jgi:phosphoserine phosphatase
VLDPFPYGEGKRRALESLASRLGLDLAASHAWANAASDAAHLEAVGHAHVVAPDAALRRLARRRGWSIHEEDHGRRRARAARPGR